MKPVLQTRRKDSQDSITEFQKLAKTRPKMLTSTDLSFEADNKQYHKAGFALKRMKLLSQVDASFISLAPSNFHIFCFSLKLLHIKSLRISFFHFDDLSDNIMKSISQSLKNFPFLCSLILDLSQDDYNEEEKEYPTPKAISMLFSGLKPLKSLLRLELDFFALSTIDSHCLEDLSFALKNFNSLQILKLNFYGCYLNDKGLLSFSNALKRLTNLKIFHFITNFCYVSDESFESFSLGLKELKNLLDLNLSLDYCGSITKKGRLEYVSSALIHLNSLSVLNLDYDSRDQTCDEDIKSLSHCFEFLPSLKIFKLSLKSCKFMTNDGIKYLGLGLACLTSFKTLELSFSHGPTIQKIENIAHSLEKLVNLSELKVHFVHCYNIDSQGIERLFESFRYLNSLIDLDLGFSGCNVVNDLALKFLSSNFSHFQHLEKLKLNFSTNIEISDVGLENLALNLDMLSSLHSIDWSFPNCHNISDNGIKSLSLGLQRLKSLTKLNLGFANNKNIGEKAIENLVSNISHLELEASFSFMQCQEINEERLKIICAPLKRCIIFFNHYNMFNK